MKKIIAIALLPLLAIACFIDAEYYTIAITNNSSGEIYCYVAYMKQDGGVYPDTTLLMDCSVLTKMEKHEVWHAGVTHSRKDFFALLPNDTVSIYFFSKDTLDQYSWNDVRKEYKILKRYDISIYNMERLNDEISYPPTAAESNIKMYPPYGR